MASITSPAYLFVACALGLSGCDKSASREASAPGTPIAAAANAAPSSGPFGIAMGTPVSSLKTKGPAARPGFFSLESAPKPHAAFPSVSVVSLPETGVCEVQAIGTDNEDDPYGASVQDVVDDVKAQLETKYGPPVKHDECVDRYCSDQHWTQELAASGRSYSYKWTSTEEHPLPENVDSIMLMASANDSFTTYAILGYRFSNYKKCKALRDKAQGNGL